MYHLVYVSYATRSLSDQDLLKILQSSRENNKALGITGMLIYLHERFIQALEGNEQKVQTLLEKIKEDPMHKKVTLILEGTSPHRLFKNWSMGFKNLSTADFTQLSGFTDIENFFAKPVAYSEGHAVMTFLQLFYKKNFVDHPEVTTY
ncbi:MAG: BLUF domain-containing protein [Cyclobacteriaceae bacterium]|nr:BLUF domain-containing protein [Cyclobacteriaceae bacterium]